MSYIILTDSQKNPGEKVALVDRTKYPNQWWTELIDRAVVFTKKETADIQCSKLKFNNPKVYNFEKGKKRLGQVEVIKNSNWLSRALDRKMSEWHDDDWEENSD